MKQMGRLPGLDVFGLVVLVYLARDAVVDAKAVRGTKTLDLLAPKQEVSPPDVLRVLVSSASTSVGRANSTRPGWGRDYGPSFDLPYNLAKDPFADAKLAAEARVKEANAQQKLIDAANPLASPIGDAVTAAKPSPEPALYNPKYVPKSPHGTTDEISPTDPSEIAGVMESGVADTLAGELKDPPDVSRFIMRSCEGVCQRCMLTTADHPSGDKCKCFANCLQGMNSTICTASPAGWSTSTYDNQVSRPVETWQASCNGGNKDCSECVNAAFTSKVKDCVSSRDPSACLSPMRTNYEPPPMDSRMRLHYCTNPALPSCEALSTGSAHRNNFNASGGWRCFDKIADCKATKLPPTEFQDVQAAPSVWETARG